MAIDAIPPSGFFSQPWVQTLIIQGEIVLGVWLICGVRTTAAWLVTVSMFVGFAAVSFWQAWIGKTSCGCFGALSISPWLSFTIDIGIVAALLWIRPDVNFGRLNYNSAMTALGQGFSAAVAIGLALICVSYFVFGSAEAALAYIRGERISIYPRWLDIGHGGPGETRDANVELRNWTDSPVRLIGGTADCSCIVTADMPITIPPGEARSLTVTVRFPTAPGIFDRNAMVLTDDEQSSRLRLRMSGRTTTPHENTQLPRKEEFQSD